MANLSDTLQNARSARDVSLEKASKDLHIKKEHLLALEQADWNALPDPAFAKGFVKNYAEYLGLDSSYVLALYRREFDPAQYPKSQFNLKKQKFFLTPTRVIRIIIGLLIFIFIFYLFYEYTSFLKSPKLEVTSPPNDQSTSVPIALISGQTEKGATISVNGEFAPVDPNGNFSYQYKLKEGQNIIEIIASKKLSPKSKVTKIVRLTS